MQAYRKFSATVETEKGTKRVEFKAGNHTSERNLKQKAIEEVGRQHCIYSLYPDSVTSIEKV